MFTGPFTIAAAEAVVGAFGDVDRVDVLDLVDRLADKSLIAWDGVDATGESRYRLLETIRHYALDRLTDAAELTEARDAHADFWAGWAASHNVHLDCSLAIYNAIPPNLANLSAATRWACVSRPELLQTLILCVGPFLQVDDDEGGSTNRLFESALATLDGLDDVAWAHVAMAATFVRTLTWVFAPDDELREPAESIAAEHDLSLVKATIMFTTGVGFGTRAPERFVSASELFDAAGSPSWSSVASATSVRFHASIGQLASANHHLLTRSQPRSEFTQAAVVGALAQVAVVEGQLADVARLARDELEQLAPPDSSMIFTFTSLAYESVARVAFFSADQDVLEWAVDVLERAARSRISRRIAAVAAGHLGILNGAANDRRPRERIDSTLRARVHGTVTGGGLLQRETPYLAIAAADPEWIAAERASIERFATDADPRVQSFTSLADAVLALSNGADRDAERHWHALLERRVRARIRIAVDRPRSRDCRSVHVGPVPLTRQPGWRVPPSRREANVGTAIGTRNETEVPVGSDTGRALSLEEATAYARRSRGERARPMTGWAALTPTEVEVARAVANGLSNKDAAERLFMSVPTVKTHLQHIFTKLAIDNRSQLVTVVSDHTR